MAQKYAHQHKLIKYYFVKYFNISTLIEILRHMYRGLIERAFWHNFHNAEVWHPDVIRSVNVNRVRWTGHVKDWLKPADIAKILSETHG